MKRLLLLLSLMSTLVVCHAELVFVAGKDYKVLDKVYIPSEKVKPGTVTVKEFFSYGCPWCFKLEYYANKWKKDLPKHIEFYKVPVVFEPEWTLYAKAYYTADILGIENKLSPALFSEIQINKKPLDTVKSMTQFFIDNGVAEKVAKSAFSSSPTIDAKVAEGIEQMQKLQVNAVPSFVINNHYKVDIAMAEGDSDKLFRVIGFLTAKELASMMNKR